MISPSPTPTPLAADRRALDGAPTVAIETHGCKLNQADSSVLANELAEAGFRLVSEHEPADVYMVNTCTVTHIADRKARQALRSARRRNPNATIVATGCYAQRAPDALAALAEVDLVSGNTEKPALVRRVVEVSRNVPRPLGIESLSIGPLTSRTRAVVKIQEGCDQVCAYCIVPKVRGRERSIPPEQVISRIDKQLSKGFKEVVLTGTQLGSYGFDLTGIDLADLLRRILAETEVARLRVSSLQPQEIDAELVGLWSDRRLCPHFHLALQSGSDQVLKRMRRRYTSRQYAVAVDMVRAAVPDVSITTDVIAGFPGETEHDFEGTYALCEGVGFASMHVFPYSARPGTSAAHFRDQVPAAVKSARVRELISLSQRLSAKFRDHFLGTTRQVLWEARREENGTAHWAGLTDNYIAVRGQSPHDLANQLTPALLHRREKDLVLAQVLS